MYARILKRMREQILGRHYVVTFHARKEMNDDGLTVYDVESCILSGKVLERQRDRATGEPKYRVRGPTVGEEAIEVVAKLSPVGKLVIITTYALWRGSST